MAVNDVKVVSMPGPTLQFRVDDRDTSSVALTIKAGEPVKETGNFTMIMEADEPTMLTADEEMLGVAAEESTETSSAEGTVLVHTLIAGTGGTIIRGTATSGEANTDTLLKALLFDCVTWDVSQNVYSSTAGTFTVDVSDDDSNTHGLKIIDGSGDSDNTVDVLVNIRATSAGSDHA